MTAIPEDYNHNEGVEIPKGGAGAANFGKHGEDENNSIGSGSGDQGLDAENADRDDEIKAMEEEELKEKNGSGTSNEGHHPAPTHGLVEEGPGPDS